MQLRATTGVTVTRNAPSTVAMASEARTVTSQTPSQFACGARLIQWFSVNVTPQRLSLTTAS